MSYHAPVPTQTRTPAPTPAEEAARRDGPAEAAPHRDRPAAGRLSAPERRASIARALADGACIAGDALAQELGVSRQVIVQDIAVLRAGGLDIVATVRGYLLAPAASALTAPRRAVAVHHGPADTERELIRANGGVPGERDFVQQCAAEEQSDDT